MSDMAKQARAAMKAKASKMTTADPHQKVDSSTWTPPEALNTEVKTGMRPVSRRAFKKGGKVMGEKAQCNLGRKPRKSGGKALTANSLISRNVKEANEERPGGKAHIGGLKTGGRAKKQGGGYSASADFQDQNAIPNPRRTAEDEEISPAMAARMRGIMDQSAAESRRYQEDEEAKRLLGIRGYKRGGKAKKAMGGPMAGSQQMMQDAQNVAGVPSSVLDSAPTQSRFSKGMGLKKGGAAKHDDVKQDMALIKKMVKPEARKGKAIGGAFGQFLSPALMLANAVRGDDKKRGGRAGKEEGGKLTRHYLAMKNPIRERHIEEAAYDVSERDPSRNKGQGPTKENAATFALRKAVGKDPYAALERKDGGKAKRTGKSGGGGNEADQALPGLEAKLPQKFIVTDRDGVQYGGTYASRKAADRAADKRDMEYGAVKYRVTPMKSAGGRTARKEGGGVFSGPGYPGKVPGVTGGRIARATGGKTKGKGKTNINIVIAAGQKQPGADMMGPPPGMGQPPGGLPIPVPPGAGAGGPPMPMPMPVAAPAPMPAPMPTPRKSGGRLTKVAHSYKDMEAGAGSGEGRLQKTDIAKFKAGRKEGGKVGHRTYRSYKDMDAGAGSGFGRLEKTEIQKRKH